MARRLACARIEANGGAVAERAEGPFRPGPPRAQVQRARPQSCLDVRGSVGGRAETLHPVAPLRFPRCGGGVGVERESLARRLGHVMPANAVAGWLVVRVRRRGVALPSRHRSLDGQGGRARWSHQGDRVWKVPGQHEPMPSMCCECLYVLVDVRLCKLGPTETTTYKSFTLCRNISMRESSALIISLPTRIACLTRAAIGR